MTSFTTKTLQPDRQIKICNQLIADSDSSADICLQVISEGVPVVVNLTAAQAHALAAWLKSEAFRKESLTKKRIQGGWAHPDGRTIHVKNER